MECFRQQEPLHQVGGCCWTHLVDCVQSTSAWKPAVNNIVYRRWCSQSHLATVPLPPRYFGNAVFRITAESTSGELVSKSLDYASGKARQAIEKATHEYLQSSLTYVKCMEDVTHFRSFHTIGCAKGSFLYSQFKILFQINFVI